LDRVDRHLALPPGMTLCPSPSGLGCAPDEEWSCVFPVMIDLSGDPNESLLKGLR
jgi:hypothetical protein